MPNSKSFQNKDHLSPYIIAEIGVNHEGSMAIAKRQIEEAKLGGAHAAKFQTYKAEKIASKNSPAYWDQSQEPTDSQFKLFKKHDSFGSKEYIELAKHCEAIGIDFLSTPFDLDAVDFLNPMMHLFKIASADITNIPLIRKCAATGKPLIMSTGAATLAEIEFAITTAKQAGASNITLLHCVLNYPTPEENAQLGYIKNLQRVFPNHAIGYSDHVVPDHTISALEMASIMGCQVLEKHFTHDKSLPGNDHYHAMDQHDLKRFCEKLASYKQLNGHQNEKDLTLEKAAIKHARRSIVAAKNIEAGEVFDENNLIAKRPGNGISPIHWDEIIGKHATTDIPEDSLLTWSQVDSE